MQPASPCSAPCFLVVDVSVWVTSLLGVAIWHVTCGFYYLFIFLPGHVAVWDSKAPHRSTGENIAWCFWVIFYDSLPEWGSVPNSFVPLFIFYIFCCLLLKTMGCLSVCLVSSASIQMLFCGIHLAFKWSFNEFFWKKVVSLSYSYTILGLPLQEDSLWTELTVQLLSCFWLFVTPWTAACQACLDITNSWNLLKFISIQSVMLSPSHPLLFHSPALNLSQHQGLFPTGKFFTHWATV